MKSHRLSNIEAAFRRLLRKLRAETTIDADSLQTMAEKMTETYHEFELEDRNRKREVKPKPPENPNDYLSRRLGLLE